MPKVTHGDSSQVISKGHHQMRRLAQGETGRLANSNGQRTELVPHAPAIAHLKRIRTPDGKFKFQFIRPVVINGRKLGLFAHHPDLWTEVRAYQEEHDKLRMWFKSQVNAPVSPSRHSG